MADFEYLTGYQRKPEHDTEAERMPYRPQKSCAQSTGFTSQAAEILTDQVMAEAMADKLASLEQSGSGKGARAADTDARASNEDAKEGDIDAADDDLEVLRARRRQQMKAQHEKKMKYQSLGHGAFDEIVEEEFLKTVTASERCIVHFYHREFERCKILNMHLGKCAKRFFGTRFVQLNAEKAPFFVDKLNIKTLPCIVVFVNGIAVGRQTGFEGLTGGDEFPTAQLAWRFREWGGLEEEFGPEDEL
eukprot:NODE_16875_length_973_cov_3.938534.p1 GENE.NODE_16875_length_973_cov_3.938534~~NODE_16875_length_973_cov_3.938534.p1  ORF type:complete len:247 (+),score=70.61 NODE_16875_length_973_cov_3.938534:113-853(+)